jgi:hypothetical protein
MDRFIKKISSYFKELVNITNLPYFETENSRFRLVIFNTLFGQVHISLLPLMGYV